MSRVDECLEKAAKYIETYEGWACNRLGSFEEETELFNEMMELCKTCLTVEGGTFKASDEDEMDSVGVARIDLCEMHAISHDDVTALTTPPTEPTELHQDMIFTGYEKRRGLCSLDVIKEKYKQCDVDLAQLQTETSFTKCDFEDNESDEVWENSLYCRCFSRILTFSLLTHPRNTSE